MRKCLLFVLVLVINRAGMQAQTGPWPLTPGYGAYSPTGNEKNDQPWRDAFSFMRNQGSLGEMDAPSVGVFTERKYMVEGLRHFLLAFMLPIQGGSAGIKAAMFGTPDYGENSYGLAYGRRLGNRFGLGIQFNYNTIRMTGYGNASAVGFEIGALMHLSERLTAGMQWKNALATRFGFEGDESFPTAYSFGLGYSASPSFFFTGLIGKEGGQGVSVSGVIHYAPGAGVRVRLGCAAELPMPWLSIGYHLGKLYIEGFASLHPQLGCSPGLQIQYSFRTSPGRIKED